MGTVMNSQIPRILEGTGLSFGVITERYGVAVCVFMAPSTDYFQFFDNELNGEDPAAEEMQRYLGSEAGARFPQGSGDTFEQAIDQLESLVETLRPDELQAWADEVRLAYVQLREAKSNSQDCPWWVSRACREGRLTAVN